MFVAVSPVYAIGIGMALNFLPLMVGAVLAALGRAAYRQLPLWYGLAILPACVAAHSTQATSWLSHGEVRPTLRTPFACLPPFRWRRCWSVGGGTDAALGTNVRTPVLRSVDEFCSTCGKSCT